MGILDFSKSFEGNRKQLIVLIGIVVVIIIVVAVFMVIMKPPPLPPPEPKEPVYEIELGDIKFELVGKAKSRGDILSASESENFEFYPGLSDVTTTEKFIEVTINAMNTGKENIQVNKWDLLEIIDEDGRKFPFPIKLTNWLPKNNMCNKELKPGFTPISCTRIYEVAKISTGLKVKIKSGDKNCFLDLGI